MSCNASFGSRQDRFGIRVVSRCNDDREGTVLVRTIFLALLAALAIGTTIVVYVGRKVSSGTRAVLDRAQAIARGDLTASRVDIESEDELGDIAGAISQMETSLSLQNLVGRFQLSSDGDEAENSTASRGKGAPVRQSKTLFKPQILEPTRKQVSARHPHAIRARAS